MVQWFHLLKDICHIILVKNNKLFEDVWNSSLLLHLLIAVTVSVVLLGIKDLMLNRVLSIDLNYMESANFIFYFAIISIFISIFQAPFNALILAKEKMSFYAGLSLYDAISKLGIVFAYILCKIRYWKSIQFCM